MRAIGIAVFAVVLLGVVYAVFDLRRDHNEISQIREQCQHDKAGKMAECVADLALRHARQPQLP
jgi:hypothetical protein